MDESDFIAALRERWPLPASALELMDDAALLDRRPNVATTDMLVEGVHFRWEWSSPEDVGWKAAAVSLSDLAAMGARPEGLLWAVGGPLEDAERLLGAAAGLAECAGRFGAELYGGDTVGAPVVVMSVTALGSADRPVRRSGARPGDLAAVTGPVGGAVAGLGLLRGVEAGLSEDVRARLVERHRRPIPRLAEGWALSHAGATAMVDLSDGLGSDLGHVARASGVAFTLEEVPLAEGVEEVARAAGEDPWLFGLGGGDDYELAFTMPAGREQDVTAAGGTVIGRVSEGEGVWWQGERVDSLGWRHQ